MQNLLTRLCGMLAAFCTVCAVLLMLCRAGVPACVPLRTLWIESAMTTGSHQWLASALFDSACIEEAEASRAQDPSIRGGERYLTGGVSVYSAPSAPDDSGDTDAAGYPILLRDTQQGITVSKVSGEGFKGHMMRVDDPSRLILVPASEPDGSYITDLLAEYDCVAGINASGFAGAYAGESVGRLCFDGALEGYYAPSQSSILLTTDNRLAVGFYPDWEQYSLRAGVQFGPVLVADGVKTVHGSSGWGVQPRCAIGQRADGTLLLLVIDGRDLSWSIGCTVDTLASLMLAYGAENAACCDGGSSAVMAYDGQVLGRSCAPLPDRGRRLPNAFLIRRK